LLAQDGIGFVTRGDSMPGVDPEFPADALLGRIVGVGRKGRGLNLPLQPWTRLVGLMFCYSGSLRRASLTLRSGNTQSLSAVDAGTA
jgi:hypothetical protein